jgi:hypothetical protein
MQKIVKSIVKSALKAIGLYNVAARLLGNHAIRKLAQMNGLNIKHVGDSIRITNKNLQRSVIISSKHEAYVWDILTDFDRYHGAVDPVIIDKMQVVDYSKPNIHKIRPYCVDLHYTSFAENMSMMEKEYFYWYKPQEGDVIFDCGAYCGDTSFIFSKLVGSSGRVYSFEPDPDNYTMLIKNVEKHNLQNVVPINKGISSHSKTVSFNSDGNLGASITNNLTNCTCQVEVISFI